MLTPAFYLHCLLTVCAAVCFADLLVQDGMLLAPVQAWLREWHKRQYMVRWLVGGTDEHGPVRYADNTEHFYYDLKRDLDSQFWWKPLWGCPTCVAGWWAFTAYVVHYHGAAYCWYEHAYFVALGLLFSLLIQWIIRRLQH